MTLHDSLRGRRSLARTLLLACGLSLLLGCASKSPVNSLLRIDDPDKIKEATDRGAKLWGGGDPYTLYSRTTQQVNVRIDQDVIVRSAAICMPKDELAFTVATLPANSTDTAVKQAVDDAVVKINQQVKFVVTLQTSKDFDPKQVDFELQTSTGSKYPVAAVPEPQLIENIPASIDGDMPAATLYGYEVYFQSSGSPGYAAIDDTVSSLTLVVKTAGAQTSIPFALVKPYERQ